MRAALPPPTGAGAPPAAGTPLRAVELMHPDGEVRSEGAIGGDIFRARPSLHPDPGRGADLLWLVPTPIQCRTQGWLADAVARVERELAVDGIAYVLPPAGWRGRVAARLREAGFRVEPPVAHVAVHARDRFLVPLGRREVAFVLRSLLPFPAPLGSLAGPLAWAPGWRRIAAESLPVVGFVARRTRSRPPYAWLEEIGGGAPAGVVVVNGWRGPGDSVLLHLLAADGAHSAVAKVARASSRADEAEVLTRLGGAAGAAGVALPRVLGSGRVGGRCVVLLTVVPGRRATEAVRSHPERVGPLLDRLAAWLEAWNRATARTAPLDEDEISREVMEPLRAVAPLLPEGEAYAARVRALCERVAGIPVPRVAAHGDLTLHNVLLDIRSLGVVDWEAAREDGWPLTDLEYAAVDAVAAAAEYRDRPGAWEACFRPGGGFVRELSAWRTRLADALAVPAPFAELCHHAAWLHHAANEASRGEAGDRPFLGIVRALAGTTGEPR